MFVNWLEEGLKPWFWWFQRWFDDDFEQGMKMLFEGSLSGFIKTWHLETIFKWCCSSWRGFGDCFQVSRPSLNLFLGHLQHHQNNLQTSLKPPSLRFLFCPNFSFHIFKFCPASSLPSWILFFSFFLLPSLMQFLSSFFAVKKRILLPRLFSGTFAIIIHQIFSLTLCPISDSS